MSCEEDSKNKRFIHQHEKFVLNPGYLRKLSLISPNGISQSIKSNPTISLQTTSPKFESTSHNTVLSALVTGESGQSPSSSSALLSKRPKRSRFDLRKTLQRSKSACMTHFNSWLQRHRQQQQEQQQQQEYSFASRKKSVSDSKTTKEITPSRCSTPKLFASPHLARLHRKILKQVHSSSSSSSTCLGLTSSSSAPLKESHLSLSQVPDDSDQHFQRRELQVRIYLPARTAPTAHCIPTIDKHLMETCVLKPPSALTTTSSVIDRRNSPPASEKGDS